MLFNSIEFALFLLIALPLFWYGFSKTVLRQNIFLIIASWSFYAWWDWRFLGLLIFSGLLSYLVALGITSSINKGKIGKGWLFIGVVLNLGVLCLFKYYDFFVQSFSNAFLGGDVDELLVNLILPVGVSFYTFQSIGYCVDVFRRNVPAEKNIINHFLFISFFPQLLAGPIGRAKNLLPQFCIVRKFDYALATDGLRQILWGLFKKMVVADNCATIVNTVWSGGIGNFSSFALIITAVLYSFQIYGDFSGYSDMAIGSAKLFGIRLGDNFLFPYFSRNVGEFWRRWHISLNTWFRDFVYISLGGSREGKMKTIRNVLIVFVLSGLWHGANWTFAFWGLFHGLLFIPMILLKSNDKVSKIVGEKSFFPSLRECVQVLSTFGLVTIGWIFFRADSIEDAFLFIRHCCSFSGTILPEGTGTPFLFIVLMLVIEWLQRHFSHGLSKVWPKVRGVRWAIYIIFIFVILQNDGMQENFIYFRF